MLSSEFPVCLIVVVFADSHEVRLSGRTTPTQRNYVMHVHTGAPTDATVDSFLTNTIVSLEDFVAYRPPVSSGVGIGIAANLYDTRFVVSYSWSYCVTHQSSFGAVWSSQPPARR